MKIHSEKRWANDLFHGLCAILVGGVLAGCMPEENGMAGPGEMPPVPVYLDAATTVDVDAYREYPARVRGIREVEIWARVQGVLEERLYEEGDKVERDAALFAIEKAPYEIAVRTAEAEIATARAALRQAERDWFRTRDLYEQDAISTRERDGALGAFEMAQAQLQGAEVRLEQAQLDLSYTDVRAPVPGVASLEAVAEGTLVGPGDKLATIVQLDPAHAYFSMPESDAKTRSAYEEQIPAEKRGVALLFPNGEIFDGSGQIDYSASSVATDTGTIQMRAVYENPESVLMPGQFLRVRLLLRPYTDVILLPEAAVGEGMEGPQVFVVEEGASTASARPVRLGPSLPEGQVILDGVQEGDRVVVRGQGRLFDGSDIEVQQEDDEGEVE